MINIDKGQVLFPDNEKQQSTKLKSAKHHTQYEKQLVQNMVAEIAEYEDEEQDGEHGIDLPSEDKWE